MRGFLTGVAAAIVSTDPFDADLLADCRDLRVIARVGVGVDSIDIDAATKCGVAVTVTPGANEETVADHTVALMLAALRRICEHDAGVRRGEWNRTGGHTPWTLHGATVGLIGFGRIGRLVARRLRGFDVEILVADPAATSSSEGVAVPLETLLRRATVVSLHAPLLPQTHHLIGSEQFALMRPEAILVNTARGPIVDEAALLAALEQGRIQGAALDVFESEPPRLDDLGARPDVVLSPHNAGLSVESVGEMTRRATASVIDVLSGRRPADLANPEVLGSIGLAELGSDGAGIHG
ncbi:MAG: phosphoglycerate dehydrogenase [Actinobacteria bacterium]|nr:phosphoglycerate dehydrogenase [Actinomycetota bacterium]